MQCQPTLSLTMTKNPYITNLINFTREKLDLSIVLGPRVFGLELKGKNTMAQRSKNLTIDGSIALISTTKGQVKPKAVSTPHRFSQKTNK